MVLHLVFARHQTAGVVDDHLLFIVDVEPVQPLVLLELDHGLTERDGVRTPDVPGRTTAHTLRLAGLHTLQEVVVLLLLAGLLRPVEEVVLGDGDVVPVIVVRLHVEPHLVLQPDPGEGEGVGDHVVELGVVENDPVVDVGV